MSSRPQSREEARRLVQAVASQLGHISKRTLDQLDRQGREEVENAVRNVRVLAATSVNRRVEALFATNPQVVAELLRNADDSEFTTARKAKEHCCVSFKVYSDRLVMECNEDGFTEDDVRSICNVRLGSPIESSRPAESFADADMRGFHFKSVFMLSRKVHIRSGHLSFRFENRRGGEGPGMICPIWQAPENEEAFRLTTTTLFFQDPIRAVKREAVIRQLRELQSESLLFFKNLTRINVTIFGDDDNTSMESTALVCEEWEEIGPGARASVTTRTTSPDNPTTNMEQALYVVERLDSLCTADSTSKTEDFRRGRSRYDKGKRFPLVSLAFPLERPTNPSLVEQPLFNVWPLKTMGFKFIISTDWVVERNGVVKDCFANKGRVHAAAELFIDTVKHFCDEGVHLRHRWVRFLPRREDIKEQWLWEPWVQCVQARLGTKPILIPLDTNPTLIPLGGCFPTSTVPRIPPRCIHELRPLRPELRSSDQLKPLFPEVEGKSRFVWLDTAYSSSDVAVLHEYGLKSLSDDELLDCVTLNINASLIWAPAANKEWHERVAALLLEFLSRSGNAGATERLRQLKLVPLSDGRWVSAGDDGGDIFFRPAVVDRDGRSIMAPRDLSRQLRLLEPSVAGNVVRVQLLSKLGVKALPAQVVRKAIIQKYMTSPREIKPMVTIEESLNHLRFLYLTQGRKVEECGQQQPNSKDKDWQRPLSQVLWLFNDCDAIVAPGTIKTFHDPDDRHPYGVKCLAGYQSHNLLSSAYFKDAPVTPASGGGSGQQQPRSQAWNEWLAEQLGIVQRRAELVRNGRLTAECRFVAERRPRDFLGFLQRAWQTERKSVLAHSRAVDELKNLNILCQGGWLERLGCTFLVQSAHKVNNSLIPVAQGLEWVDADDLSVIWSDLDLLPSDLLDYFLRVVRYVKDKFPKPGDVPHVDSLLRIYASINQICAVREAESAKVRDFFHEHKCLFIPERSNGKAESDSAQWTTPQLCWWEAPGNICGRWPLRDRYSRAWEEDADKRWKPLIDSLTPFFNKTLQIQDMDHHSAVQELKEIQALHKGRCVDFKGIVTLYRLIRDSLHARPEAVGDIRRTFEECRLIYLEFLDSFGLDQQWFSPSECVWTCTSGAAACNVVLGDVYVDDLQSFFEQDLGVKKDVCTEELAALLTVFTFKARGGKLVASAAAASSGP